MNENMRDFDGIERYDVEAFDGFANENDWEMTSPVEIGGNRADTINELTLATSIVGKDLMLLRSENPARESAVIDTMIGMYIVQAESLVRIHREKCGDNIYKWDAAMYKFARVLIESNVPLWTVMTAMGLDKFIDDPIAELWRDANNWEKWQMHLEDEAMNQFFNGPLA